MRRAKTEAIERFESKYIPEPNTGCWLWTAGLNGDGYGSFHVGGNNVGAHRFSFETYVGPIHDGLHVLHRCDQPLCVNPKHLFLGSQAANMADMVEKDRQARGDRNGSRLHPERRPRGEQHVLAKLTASQVLEIRAAVGESQRRIAARFGVSKSQVGDIRSGKKWAHMPIAAVDE